MSPLPFAPQAVPLLCVFRCLSAAKTPPFLVVRPSCVREGKVLPWFLKVESVLPVPANMDYKPDTMALIISGCDAMRSPASKWP